MDDDIIERDDLYSDDDDFSEPSDIDIEELNERSTEHFASLQESGK